jgi:hypothetical protein
MRSHKLGIALFCAGSLFGADVARADEQTHPNAQTSASDGKTPGSPPPARWAIGVEADLLPYVLHGWHADAWVGRGGWRARAIAVSFLSPSVFTPSGFRDQRTTMYEVEVDRFFGSHADTFRGPWVAAGGGLSLLTIDADDGSGHASASVFEVSVGVGWSFALPAGFYIDPWIGGGYQSTPTTIDVGAHTWNPTRLNPALGLKLGWSLLP